MWILHGEIYMRENWFIFVDAAGWDFGGSYLRIPWEGISLGFKSEEAHNTMQWFVLVKTAEGDFVELSI